MLGLVLALTGCDVYDRAFLGVLDGGPEDASQPPVDAGDENDAAPADAGPACESREPPPKPTGPDGGDQELVFVLRDIVIDDGGSDGMWRTTGFNLDGSCTSSASPQSECVPKAGTAPPDGEGGIDNIFARNFLPLALMFQPTLPMDAPRNQEKGIGAMLLKVSGWNGEDDDPSVEVFLAPTVFAERPDAPGEEAMPEWDGEDVWFVNDAVFIEGNVELPMIEDENAHIADRTVVMELPDRSEIFMPFTGNVLALRLSDAMVVGRISDDGTRLEEATMAGRWRNNDIAAALSAAGLCESEFPEWRDFIDGLLLSSSDVLEERGDLDEECNAMSVGLRFTGYAAELGGTATPEPQPPPCE